jgi:hypothetical protein
MLRKYKLNKKGDLTFNQIVIAVIALIVLVILIVVFSGNIKGQSSTLSSCAINKGTCEDQGNCKGMVRYGNYSDCVSPKVCCITFFSTKTEEK